MTKVEKELSKVEKTEAQFRAQYATYQYYFVEFFTEHLADCSRAFGGDLQQMLVLALMGQMHLKALMSQKDNADHMTQTVRDQKITASRIADAAGIPRETVRRKLSRLAELGWVEQERSGAWRLVIEHDGARARRDLADLDSRALSRVATLYTKLQTIT